MQHTLVAVFDNRSDAQNAMDELLASGFSRNEVNVSSADPTGQTSSLSTSSGATGLDTEHHEGIGASIRHFFSGIFGTDNAEHAQRYSDVVSRGHHVLTITTESEPEVERAADVIERFGPVDIDERHDLSGSAASMDPAMLAAGASAGSGLRSSSMQSGSMGSGSGSMGSGSMGSGSMGSGSLGSGSIQSIDEDRKLFGTQDYDDTAARDTTFQEPMGGNMQADSLGRDDSLQGTASLQGSDDASLGGTAMRSGSLQGGSQSGSQSGSQQRDTTAIPVVQEELKVGKREVQRGGVRVFSRVVTTPVNESVSLREEHVNVERRPVDQPISGTDASAFKEQSIELREKSEEAVVQKSARVVEEVVVGKDVTQRQEQIKDSVRHTEVQVEKLGAQDDDSYYRKHWNTNYGSSGGNYDDYQPAYLYGTEARRKYQGRNWDDVETNLRSDWDARNTSGGPSTWEKMKNAVRGGWDRMTS